MVPTRRPSAESKRGPRRGREHIERPPPHDGRDVWIFAYGSLMWHPGFPYEEARPALLRGYHRSFCLYSHQYRGTPEKPGLVLGLDAGGSCRGIAYRVKARNAKRVMAYLWRREMPARTYACREVKVELAGRAVRACAFIVRRDHPQYAPDLTVQRTVELVCQVGGFEAVDDCCPGRSHAGKCEAQQGEPSSPRRMSSVERRVIQRRRVWRARSTAAWRLRTPSLRYRLRAWVFTVFTETNSSPAISGCVSGVGSRRRSASSRGVSDSRVNVSGCAVAS